MYFLLDNLLFFLSFVLKSTIRFATQNDESARALGTAAPYAAWYEHCGAMAQ